MHIVRTILALLLTLSVAFLPATGSVAAAGLSSDPAIFASMPDCDHCPPADHSSKAMDGCMSIAGCAVKCFNYVGATVSAPMFVSMERHLEASRTSQVTPSEIANPPFRPPRV